jgi:hypothetical protein
MYCTNCYKDRPPYGWTAPPEAAQPEAHNAKQRQTNKCEKCGHRLHFLTKKCIECDRPKPVPGTAAEQSKKESVPVTAKPEVNKHQQIDNEHASATAPEASRQPAKSQVPDRTIFVPIGIENKPTPAIPVEIRQDTEPAVDPELTAISCILGLDKLARERVMEYLIAKFYEIPE